MFIQNLNEGQTADDLQELIDEQCILKVLAKHEPNLDGELVELEENILEMKRRNSLYAV